MKIVLSVNKSTASNMIYGELIGNHSGLRYIREWLVIGEI
jgi:hypothetical protein